MIDFYEFELDLSLELFDKFVFIDKLIFKFFIVNS